MKLEFGFGQTVQSVDVPDRNLLGVLVPNVVPHELSDEAEVLRAMARPIGSPRLEEVVKPDEKIVIVSSDITRPMPTFTVLPPVLDALYRVGVKQENITLVLALGTHRPHTDEERRHLVGERAWSEILCCDSTPDDVIHLGTTKRGTPVDISRQVAQADRRILLGNVEFHYFAGYSGGAKAIMPGCSTRDAIRNNHSLMVSESACAGRLDGNPLREDLEEAARLCGVDFIVNVVLDEHKKIIHASAGDVTMAHRDCCAFLNKLYLKEIPSKADIVIVSQGGAPKDMNLYQTQKALDNAKHAVKDGGIIILIGSCREGMGEKTFERWMMTASSPASLVERIRHDFQIGGHKAAAIAMVLSHADIYLVSEMPAEFIRKIFLTPFSTAQQAYEAAVSRLGPEAKVLSMPYGGSTLPRLKD